MDDMYDVVGWGVKEEKGSFVKTTFKRNKPGEELLEKIYIFLLLCVSCKTLPSSATFELRDIYGDH